RAGPLVRRSRHARRVRRAAAGGQRVLAPGGADPAPDLLARGDRAEPPDRLRRTALARHRRLHGRRSLRGVQADDRVPVAQHHRLFVLSGVVAAGVGLVFGIPSLRIKGFYLAVATLAAQFFLVWLFNTVAWFVNYAPSGTITAPPRTVAGVMVTGPEATAAVRYVTALGLVVLFAWVAKNLVRGRVGRSWMAIRDRDIAAEIIGIRPLRTKLLAFAISSFYCGVAGAEFVFLYLGSAE